MECLVIRRYHPRWSCHRDLPSCGAQAAQTVKIAHSTARTIVKHLSLQLITWGTVTGAVASALWLASSGVQAPPLAESRRTTRLPLVLPDAPTGAGPLASGSLPAAVPPAAAASATVAPQAPATR